MVLLSGKERAQQSKAKAVNQSSTLLVRFHLLTGRTHQIRVHCEHAGFPLVGDPVYTNHAPHKSAWPESIANFPRQALHAATLRLTHPQTQKEMTFECSLPEDMTAIIQELEKL